MKRLFKADGKKDGSTCLNLQSHTSKFQLLRVKLVLSAFSFCKSNCLGFFTHRPFSNRVHQKQKKGEMPLMAAVRARRVTLSGRKIERKSWRETRPDPNGKRDPPPRYLIAEERGRRNTMMLVLKSFKVSLNKVQAKNLVSNLIYRE